MDTWTFRADRDEMPTWSKMCERCDASWVERWPGEDDVTCPNCAAIYTARGQRRRGLAERLMTTWRSLGTAFPTGTGRRAGGRHRKHP